jgi:rare lipoprotein A
MNNVPTHMPRSPRIRFRACATLLICLLVTACSTTPRIDKLPPPPDRDGAPDNVPIDVMSVPDAVPRYEPKSRYGNPPSYVVFGKTYKVMDSAAGYVARGTASWYGTKFHGERTSSGEPYDMYTMTAAHKTLPIPCYARVTNLDNGRSVVLRINDRGPFHDDRLIDLSYTAAARLGILGVGTGRVEVQIIDTRPAATYAATPTSSAAQATAAAVHGSGDNYLQVGAFARRDNADLLRARLENAEVRDIRISEARNGNGTTMYRVRVGPLQSMEDINRMTYLLNRLGLTTTHVASD